MLFLVALTLADTLDPEQLLRDILQENPDISSATAAVEQARAAILPGTTWSNPMVDLSVAPLSLADMPGWTLQIRQDLPLWGSGRVNREMAEADAKAAEARLAMMRLELAQMATMEWINWVLVHRELELLEDAEASLSALHDSLLARSAAGLASDFDILQLETEQINLSQQQQQLLLQRDLVAYSINTLLHRSPQTPLLPPPQNLPPPDSIPTISDRPEPIEAAAMTRAAEAGAEMATLDRAPMVGLMAGWDAMEEMPTDRMMIGISIQVPLDQRLVASREAQAQAEVKKAKAEEAKAGDRVQMEQAAAARRYAAQQESVKILENRLLPTMEARAKAATDGYAAGTVELKVLIDAQRAVLETRIRLEEARALLVLDSRNLSLSMGNLPGGLSL